MEKEPLRVCITGGAGQIAYSLIPYFGNGYVFGQDQPVILHLLDIPPAMNALKGVVLEIEDFAFPLIVGIVPTDDPDVAFKDVDAAVFLGSFPRKKGMERKDLLEKNVGIFKGQGQALNKNAKATCKIVVVGNPANTNCLALMKNAPNIPKQNFSALTRLDHNRAISALSSKLSTHQSKIQGVCIWGNHSSTQYPDLHNTTVNGAPALDSLDASWYTDTYIPAVQKRGAAIIAARGVSSAASAAKAAADHVRDWFQGTDATVSMAVISDGNNYNVPEGLIYSFPVQCADGEWKIIDGLPINDFSRQRMNATAAELQEEADEALKILSAM